MISWTILPYDMQLKIMARLQRLINSETDPDIKEGLEAAQDELMLWSNSPPISASEEE